MCSHESLNEERDLSRVLASSKEQSSNDSLRQSEQSSSSWHELQMVDAESLCDPGERIYLFKDLYSYCSVLLVRWFFTRFVWPDLFKAVGLVLL